MQHPAKVPTERFCEFKSRSLRTAHNREPLVAIKLFFGVNMFNAQLRSDIETLDVTINNYERMENAPEAWCRIKNVLEEKFNSTLRQPTGDNTPPSATPDGEITPLQCGIGLSECSLGVTSGVCEQCCE